MRANRNRMGVAAIAAAALFVLAAAPLVGSAADHLDAPGLQPPSGEFQADINDVFVFEGANSNNTVLAVTTNPAAGVFSPTTFGDDVLYQIKIDTNGDAREDLAYKIKFSEPRDDGTQNYVVKLATGKTAQKDNPSGKQVAKGEMESFVDLRSGGRVFAGLRSDPFFFDLDAFRGTTGVDNARAFNDGNENDFFAPLDTLAIVIEVPDASLGRNIGVWAETAVESGGNWSQTDRMGRPAINTVFNTTPLGGNTGDKNAFNRSEPRNDFAGFSDNVINVLLTLSALDDEGAYTQSQAETLASILLPDILTYDTSTAAVGPLNGRNLADDVIDVELNIVTGGFPFDGRDDVGAIPGDGVGPHSGQYLPVFPYIGEPH